MQSRGDPLLRIRLSRTLEWFAASWLTAELGVVERDRRLRQFHLEHVVEPRREVRLGGRGGEEDEVGR